ncbi:MAG: type II/IV secretion system ATPase subunit [Candidatus Bathyarchaeia archaeon]
MKRLLKLGEKKAEKKIDERKEKAESPAPPLPPNLRIISINNVIPPYTHVAVTRDAEGKLGYVVIEPHLSDYELNVINRIREILVEELDLAAGELGTPAKREEFLKGKVQDIINRYKIKLDPESVDKVIYYLIRDFVYLGKIEPFMRDHMIEDISCDAPNVPIYIWHREYESLPTNITFEPEELNKFVVKLAYLAGRHISVAQPIVDGSLPDGSRINLTFGSEVTKKGSSFTIRKFRADPLTITDLIAFNTISAEIGAYLWFLIENKASIIVSGGTATGKTTFLNCLAMFIRPELKIVTIEDTAELNIPQENLIQALTRSGFGIAGKAAEITLFDLLKNAMRQRPDYIIVGEIRGEEAYTLLQAITTGHGGLSSMHADSVQSAIYRLESEPMKIPRNFIAAINAIIILGRPHAEERAARRLLTCTEIMGMDPETKHLLTNTIYQWDAERDDFVHTGTSNFVKRVMAKKSLTEAVVNEDLGMKSTILRWMVENNIRRHSEVADIIRQFYFNPERLYSKAKFGLKT